MLRWSRSARAAATTPMFSTQSIAGVVRCVDSAPPTGLAEADEETCVRHLLPPFADAPSISPLAVGFNTVAGGGSETLASDAAASRRQTHATVDSEVGSCAWQPRPNR